MAQLGVDYADTDTINKPGVAGFAKAKAAGARIVIPRGAYGRPANGQSPVYLDSYWARDKSDIVAAGLVRSSYLFVCVPTAANPTPSPAVQVDAFCNYVQLDKPVPGTKPHDMVPFFDVEQHSDVLSADAYYNWILEVAKLLRSAFGAWPGFAPGAVDMNRANIVKRGATGGTVKWIQTRAGDLVVDGDFGPKTEARIKLLQTQYALSADGIVGIDTTVLLSWLNPAPI